MGFKKNINELTQTKLSITKQTKNITNDDALRASKTFRF